MMWVDMTKPFDSQTPTRAVPGRCRDIYICHIIVGCLLEVRRRQYPIGHYSIDTRIAAYLVKPSIKSVFFTPTATCIDPKDGRRARDQTGAPPVYPALSRAYRNTRKD